jgi:hypothetical protein
VTVLSACDAWAVGDFFPGGTGQTLIEHWDGANWTVIDSPDPGATGDFLDGVRAASPTSVWAVGGQSTPGGEVPLILHWNGTQWTQQGAPSVPGGQLDAVRAVSGGEAWAVGFSSDGITRTSLVLHLTGGAWRQVSVPAVTANDELSSVAATSAHDVWAVGTAVGTGASPVAKTLILHWNGKAWTHVPSPSPGKVGNLLNAVGVSSPTSALAVGEEITGSPVTTLTLALRWNGKAWTHVPSASPGSSPSTGDLLNGVTVTSQDSAIAVGTVVGAGANNAHALIERWNGSRWTTVPSPDPGVSSELFGIGASSASSAWAVGATTGASNKAFALRCC